MDYIFQCSSGLILPVTWQIYYFYIYDIFPGAAILFSPSTSIGSECPGVWNSAAEESPAWTYCAVLRLLKGSSREDLDHLHGVHARGKSSTVRDQKGRWLGLLVGLLIAVIPLTMSSTSDPLRGCAFSRWLVMPPLSFYLCPDNLFGFFP